MSNRGVGRVGMFAAVALVVLGLAACGDDAPTLPLDDAATETESPPAADQGDAPAPATGDADAWCATFFEVDDWLMSLDPAFEEDEFRAMAAEALPVWSRLLPNAPAPIRNDVAAIAQQLERVAAGDVDALFEGEYDDAYLNIDDYVFEVCGFAWAD